MHNLATSGESRRYVVASRFRVEAFGTIAANVRWMERGFNAGQTHRSIYLSIFNRLRVIENSEILVGNCNIVKSIPGSIPLNVAGTAIPLSDRVKILGATLDSNLTMYNHTKSVSKSCFYHIRSLRHAHPLIFG